jgi:hypothetical protein
MAACRFVLCVAVCASPSNSLPDEWQVQGILPNVSTYSAAINAYGRAQLTERTLQLQLLYATRSRGMAPDEITYSAAIRVREKRQQPERAPQLLAEYTYSAATSAREKGQPQRRVPTGRVTWVWGPLTGSRLRVAFGLVGKGRFTWVWGPLTGSRLRVEFGPVSKLQLPMEMQVRGIWNTLHYLPATSCRWVGVGQPAPLLLWVGVGQPAPQFLWVGVGQPAPLLLWVGVGQPAPQFLWVGVGQPAPLLHWVGVGQPAPLCLWVGVGQPDGLADECWLLPLSGPSAPQRPFSAAVTTQRHKFKLSMNSLFNLHRVFEPFIGEVRLIGPIIGGSVAFWIRHVALEAVTLLYLYFPSGVPPTLFSEDLWWSLTDLTDDCAEDASTCSTTRVGRFIFYYLIHARYCSLVVRILLACLCFGGLVLIGSPGKGMRL